MPHQHKSGTLKQSNKKHKGVASKRELKRGLGPGKTESSRSHASVKARSTSNMALEARNKRTTRDFNAKKSERMQQWLDKRIGTASSGGVAGTRHSGIPKVVVFVPLSPAASTMNLPRSLVKDDDCVVSNVSGNPNLSQVQAPADSTGSVENTVLHSVTYAGKTNMRCTFIQPRFDLAAVIEAVKAADIVVYNMSVPAFVHQAGQMTMTSEQTQSDREAGFISSEGFEFITAIKAIGTPLNACCFTGFPPGGTSNANTSLTNKERQYFQGMKQLGVRMATSHLYKDIKTMEYVLRDFASTTTATTNGGAMTVDGASGSTNTGGNNPLLRFIHETVVSCTDHRMLWRMNRSYMVIDSVFADTSEGSIGDATADTADQCGPSVYVRGYIRNKPLPVDSLLHVVGVGTGAVVSIRSIAPGAPKEFGADGSYVNSATTDVPALVADTNRQDSLTMEAAPDVLQGEQTWPMEGEEDMPHCTEGEYSGGGDRDKPTTDGYHDEWFQENEQADDGGDICDDFEGSVAGSVLGGGGHKTLQKSYAPILTKNDIDIELQFPDEVDTPALPLTVRSQFVNYRALQNFRDSDWHPKENLPLDYSKIFQFQQFSVTQRRELNRVKEVSQRQDAHLCGLYQQQLDQRREKHRLHTAAGVKSRSASFCEVDGDVAMGGTDDIPSASAGISGTTGSNGSSVNEHALCVPGSDNKYVMSNIYVEIELRGLDATQLKATYNANGGCGFVYSLLKHENKMSVCHISLTTLPIYEELFGGDTGTTLLKGKTPLVFQIGFRTPFVTKPVFSESNMNCDKQKMTRFLEPGKFTTATIYAPITYLSCPVLIYAQDPRKSPSTPLSNSNINISDLVLIATGSLESIDPDRIILKKAILTGVPIRVKKRFGVVKYMFNEPTDVKYYQPAELATKHGLRGHIREPVGTHGLFKAIFNAPIRQNDTILLVLYKRVFPKFYTEPVDGSMNVEYIESGEDNQGQNQT